jgi:hypothetical protein
MDEAFPAEAIMPGMACGPFDWAQDKLIPAYDLFPLSISPLSLALFPHFPFNL